MKIRAFRRLSAAPGVSIFDLGRHQVPIDEVVAGRMTDVGTTVNGEVRLQRPGGRWRSRRSNGSDPGVPVAPIKARIDGRTESFKGVISYRTPAELVDFLLKQYVPGQDSLLGRLMRHVANVPLRRKRDEVNEALFSASAQNSTESICRMAPAIPESMVLGLIGESTEISGVGPIVTRREIDGPVALCLTSAQVIGGREIPRRDFVMFRASLPPEGFLAWEGGRLWGGSLSDEWEPGELWSAVGGEFKARLDREGTAIGGAFSTGVVPQDEVTPVALIRVPKRPEAALAHGAPPAFARGPFLVFDSRTPMALPADLPVVEDEKAATYVLSRAFDGIYTPDDVPGEGLAFSAEETPWVIAAKVTA